MPSTYLGMCGEGFCHCEFHPIYGTGQGSACTTTVRCIISCGLLGADESKSNGAYFRSPDGRRDVKFHMMGFGDDLAKLETFVKHT